MALAKRIIPCLDVTDGRVVKGVNFVNLRDAGDPVEIAQAYDAQEADELVFLDITASSHGRETMVDVVFRTAECVFMPLTVGGGIRNLDDMRKMLLAGADKVSINTSAVQNPELIRQGAERFGSQCIVVAIDAKGRRLTDRQRAAGYGQKGNFLGMSIVQISSIEEEEMLQAFGENLGMNVVKLSGHTIDPEVLALLPGEVLAVAQAIPVAIEGKTVMVAFADPFNAQAIDGIRLLLERDGYELQPAIAREDDVEAALSKYYPQAKAELDRLLAEQMHKAEEALEQAVEEELGVEEKIERIFGDDSSVKWYIGDVFEKSKVPAPGTWEVYTHGGRTPTGLDAVEWAKRAESLGAGEILLTSMDRDGTKDGYDIELTRTISEAVSIPVIASGGAGTLEHLYEALEEGKADAVLAASIFHFRQHTIREAREFLRQRGVPVRE